MCTVSVLRGPFVDAPDDLRWRVVFNRDERVDRPEARPPQVHRHGGVTALYPLDPEGGGTWIAATSAGLVLALLNETAGTVASRPPRSRGLVVTQLLSSRSLEEVQFRLGQLPLEEYRPFRLLAVGDVGVLEAAAAGDIRWRIHEPDARFVRASSSVAPAATVRKRRALFERLVSGASLAAQDAFHRHHGHSDPDASVIVRRPDAVTVSLTTIDAFARGFRLAYRPWPAGTPDVTDVPRAA